MVTFYMSEIKKLIRGMTQEHIPLEYYFIVRYIFLSIVVDLIDIVYKSLFAYKGFLKAFYSQLSIFFLIWLNVDFDCQS